MKFVLSTFLMTALVVPAFSQRVRFETSLGNIDVVLLPDDAPKTVENFMNYVNKGAYNNTFFHRMVRGFVAQAGGFRWANGAPQQIPQDPPVVNEYKVSNTRGTIAMAKLGDDPNSATNQWFFNLGNNSGNLDNQNGGFTVFGRVADDESLAVLDRIGALPIVALQSPYNEIPLRDYSGGNVTEANLVLVKSITSLEAPQPPVITGILSAGSFGGYTSATPGSYIEIYGSNLAGSERSWAQSDFSGNRAPRSLDNVAVTIGGVQGYISYVSPGQVNVQVPQSVSNGSLPVVVTYRSQASAPASLEIKATGGGLLAPPSFRVNDKQYAAALHEDQTAFVSNGEVPGIPAAPARRGERLTFYGVGFGAVHPGSLPYAGEIVRTETTLANPVQFEIGGIAAPVHYQGLVVGLVGVYQFTVEVPANAPGGDQPLRVLQGGQPIEQTLILPIAAQ